MKKRGLPKWVSEFKDRHGKYRFRARRKGFPTLYFKAAPGTDAFEAEYRAWRDGSARPEVGISRTRPGSVSDVVARYYRSTAWAGLAPLTKSSRRNILERFREEHGDKPIAALQREHVKRIIEARTATPEAANNLLKMLKQIMHVAVDAGMRRDDPTLGVRGIRTKSPGFHSWDEAEIATFEAKHPIGTRARLALALMLYTGQRRSDVVVMGRQHIKNDRIHLRQQKTGVALAVPVHAALAEVLDATPLGLTFLVTQTGKPFTAAGFGNWFREMCEAAGLPKQCSAHGLRKAAARRLAEAGCSASQIAAVTGHKSLREVERYVAAASQMILADAAMAAIKSGTNFG
jgi:integrase